MLGNYILCFIAVVLMIIGLVDLIRMLILWGLHIKEEDEIMIVVPISGHNEEAELLLRSAAAKVCFMEGFKSNEVICLDCGMDEETRSICENVVKGYSFMRIEDVLSFQKNCDSDQSI